MIKSESTKEIATALNGFQSKMKAIPKDAVNPFYKSRYTSLDAIWEAIRKPLAESGLAVTQTLDTSPEGAAVMDTTLLHTSGEWIGGSMPLNPVKNDPQGLGSAIAYARRYSLSAMLGIVADEDDDAESAKEQTQEAKPEAKPKSKPKEKDINVSTEDITAEGLGKLLITLKEKDEESFKRLLDKMNCQVGELVDTILNLDLVKSTQVITLIKSKIK